MAMNIFACIGGQAQHSVRPARSEQYQPPATVTANLGPIVDRLTAAGATLKFPTLRFAADGVKYRLSLAGPMARLPGSVNVTTDGRSRDDRTFFGRIDYSGNFQPHHAQVAAATAIVAALTAFAQDPVGTAKAYGQAFGRCCFCGLELTNKRSRELCYGPICAEKWGLPY